MENKTKNPYTTTIRESEVPENSEKSENTENAPMSHKRAAGVAAAVGAAAAMGAGAAYAATPATADDELIEGIEFADEDEEYEDIYTPSAAGRPGAHTPAPSTADEGDLTVSVDAPDGEEATETPAEEEAGAAEPGKTERDELHPIEQPEAAVPGEAPVEVVIDDIVSEEPIPQQDIDDIIAIEEPEISDEPEEAVIDIIEEDPFIEQPCDAIDETGVIDDTDIFLDI